MKDIYLVIHHTTGQIYTHPVVGGWRIDWMQRCLIIGSGLPRKYIPLDSMAYFEVEEAEEV